MVSVPLFLVCNQLVKTPAAHRRIHFDKQPPFVFKALCRWLTQFWNRLCCTHSSIFQSPGAQTRQSHCSRNSIVKKPTDPSLLCPAQKKLN